MREHALGGADEGWTSSLPGAQCNNPDDGPAEDGRALHAEENEGAGKIALDAGAFA
jgi:hypothetical protein